MIDAFTLMDLWCEEKKPFFFVVDFKGEKPLLFPLEELQNRTDVLVKFPNYTNTKEVSIAPEISFQKFPISFEEYEKQFANIQQELHLGNSYLTNLTIETELKTQNSLREIFQQAQAKYKVYIENQLVCFSPEIFVKIIDNEIVTFPMKGTINASVKNAESLLLANEKEKAEHCTVVDLLRNDVSKVARNVEVKRFRYIEKLKTQDSEILQASSEISGKLMPEFHNKIGSILYELLPAGSISGAPKQKTVEIITQTETHKRNYYTGIMGIFDGKNLDSAVMIRYIEQRNLQLFYKSGGGITHLSQAEEEYQELLDKIYVPIS